MTGLVAKLHKQPFILEQVDDGMIIAEPLRFISLGSIAAHRRHSRDRANAQLAADEYFRVHGDPNTETGSHNHGA